MNILKVLSESTFYVYYGKEDMSTNITLSKLIEKKNDILLYFNEKYDCETINQHKYIDYIWITNILQFEEVMEYIKDNNDFKELFKIFKQINFQLDDVLEFVKKNYIELFTIDDDSNKLRYYEIVDFTIELIYKNFNSFDRQVFEHIEFEYANIIIRKFEICKLYYNENKEYFSKIFEISRSKHLFDVRSINYTFDYLNTVNEPYVKDLLEKKAKQALLKAIELAENTNEDNYMENITWITRVSNLVKDNNINVVELYKLDSYQDKLEEISEKYFKKHGKEFKLGPINFQEMFDIFKSNFVGDEAFSTYFQLTHIFNKEKEKFISNFVSIFNQEPALTDIIASTPNTDDYFSSSRLMHLNLYMNIHAQLLYMILSDIEVEETFYEMILVILKDIDNNESEGNLELVESFVGLYPTLKEVLLSHKFDETNKYKSMSVSMFMISLIEKILRQVTINLSVDIRYIPTRYLTLGNLLRTKNYNSTYFDNILANAIDIEVIKALEFLLGRTFDSKIGNNLRNNLMHNINIKFSRLDSRIPSHVFILLLMTINSIYARYLNINIKAKK